MDWLESGVSAWSAPIAVQATMDAATETAFLCGPCQDIISRIISECSAVELVS
jgi:hypothetical protein